MESCLDINNCQPFRLISRAIFCSIDSRVISSCITVLFSSSFCSFVFSPFLGFNFPKKYEVQNTNKNKDKKDLGRIYGKTGRSYWRCPMASLREKGDGTAPRGWNHPGDGKKQTDLTGSKQLERMNLCTITIRIAVQTSTEFVSSEISFCLYTVYSELTSILRYIKHRFSKNEICFFRFRTQQKSCFYRCLFRRGWTG